LAKRLSIPFWTVDADVVVPSQVFARSFYLLHHFRPHLRKELPSYLVEPKKVEMVKEWKPWKAISSFSLTQDITESYAKIDRGVRPVDSFTGGSHAAMKRLSEFVKTELKDYEQLRNHP
jgi:deoxyribodipyrimidine photo-lyase